MQEHTDLNPFVPAVLEDPYAVYAELRRRGVYQLPTTTMFLVTRFRDVEQVLMHPEVFSVHGLTEGLTRDTPELREIEAQGWPAVDVLSKADPPAHTGYRSVVNRSFSAQSVKQLEPRLQEIAHSLIDAWISAGEVEFVSQFAKPFPLYVFAELMGLPQEDIPQVKLWCDARIERMGGSLISYARDLECARQVVEFQHYLFQQIAARRTAPSTDLISHMMTAPVEGFAGRALTTEELISMIDIILLGGNDTTINLLSSGMALLLQHSEQLAGVYADPLLIPNFVEEALRVESPVQCLFRTAKEDTEVGGVRVPQGARLAIMYGAANRDAEQFPDPDHFDVQRPNAKMSVAFGAGIHFCLGASLARLEGKVAFEALLTRLGKVRLAEGKNDFRHALNPVVRGLKELHLKFDPVAPQSGQNRQ
ncbi:MAG TPA: cytochrome P450 [Candidatus Binatia bacterium]|nr:cytochrome P450 [Candidatus Binatia bacterium]